MSADKSKDKQTVVYSYNGKLVSKRKNQTTEKHNNMDESLEHYTEQKEPDTNKYTLYDSIYIKF